MNDINKSKKIGKPYVIKEKNGIWKVCFKYKDTFGKEKKYYYSDDLNDSKFFVLDSKGKKKLDKNGNAEIKNINERKTIAKRRIERLEEDLDNFEFIVDGGYFALGDTDKKITDLLQEFLTFKIAEGTINDKTYNIYNSKVSRFKAYLDKLKAPNLTLKDFTKEHFSAFLSYIIVDLEQSKGYRDDFLVFFQGFYNHLIDYKNLQISNITKTIKRIDKGKTKMHQAVEIDDFHNVIQEVEAYNDYLAVMYKFIFFTLHRIETIVSIQFKDIDLKRNLIHLSSDIVKNYEQLSISLAEPLQELIKAYLKENEVDKDDYLFGKDYERAKIKLFGKVQSKANTFSTQFSAFKRGAIEKGSKYISEYTTLYSAKHSGIKFLLESGYTPNQIITITGHTNVNQLGAYAKDYKPVKVQFPPLPVKEKL
ncbi:MULTISPECIES: tyrosine-type recombinase/integrase [unclassified Sphingobacterium]|uniref:tyrosine-type recombinase/integrase n=1 Tax=unclassified Sphingobacterium TaxID=2609468 RepID=UPI0025FBCFFF|nr:MULTISPECIES: site-specific integrase [unclassified Sphingobacterium]